MASVRLTGTVELARSGEAVVMRCACSARNTHYTARRGRTCVISTIASARNIRQNGQMIR